MKSHIKKLREDRGLTQVQVATRAQLSVRGYQKLEAGRCQPKYRTAQKLAIIFGVTVDELYSQEDAKTDESTAVSVNQF